MNEAAMPATAKHAGLLESALHKLFMRTAHVDLVEDVGTAFRVVTLAGKVLCNAGWAAGDKLQVQLGGWTQRTYTPLEWSPEIGHTRILVHLHGSGPGAHWGRSVRAGDTCTVFGPRKSIDLVLQAQPAAAVVLTGKASSILHMRKALRSIGVGANRLQVKAYWKPGKTGLD